MQYMVGVILVFVLSKNFAIGEHVIIYLVSSKYNSFEDRVTKDYILEIRTSDDLP